MQKVSPFLWFDNEALEAAEFYVSVFKDAQILSTNFYPEGAGKPEGTVMTVRFVLDGEEFTALNGGPEFTFSSAISFVISCDSQDEVDYYWERLTEGGQEVQCGWLTDKFGLSWQVVPTGMYALFNSADKAASQRAYAAMLQMKKLDLGAMQRAFDNE